MLPGFTRTRFLANVLTAGWFTVSASALPASRFSWPLAGVPTWQAGVAHFVSKIGWMSVARLGAAAWQVSFMASRSRLPPETAVAAKRATPGLMPVSAAGFVDTMKPAGVQVLSPSDRAPSAAFSEPASRPFTETLATGPVQGGTLMHAASGIVQMPSARPSMSQLDPSTQVVCADDTPAHSTKQSVAAGPPPAKQPEGGHWARATAAVRSS